MVRAREVRVIDESGAQLGIMSSRDALQAATERDLDLIEVSPNGKPPVCRIMDYGKFKYQQSKRDKDAHRKQKATELKLIRVRPKIDDHDLQIKLKNVRKFLSEGNKVRINLFFRSRELSHPEFGRRILDRMMEATQDLASVEKPPGFEGRMMTMILGPK